VPQSGDLAVQRVSSRRICSRRSHQVLLPNPFPTRLKAGNGEIIALSEAYETRASAKNGIESLKKNAPDAAVVDLSE
jgi:uncharacterized protein YegP (UPF0339 family)